MKATRRYAQAAVLALLLGGASILVTGCAEAVVGGGATVAAAASEERGFVAVVTDTAIAANINALWIDHNADLVTHVDATISEGRVLLTGTVPTQQMRLDAVRIAWRSPGVKEVLNEIVISDADGVDTYARDSWITTQLVGRLTLDKHIQSINYSVETVNGTVYLMGIAQNQAELERVRNQARHVRYVRRIVSYVRLKTDPRRAKGGT